MLLMRRASRQSEKVGGGLGDVRRNLKWSPKECRGTEGRLQRESWSGAGLKLGRLIFPFPLTAFFKSSSLSLVLLQISVDLLWIHLTS